jgi:hypothetical protein
MGYFFILFQLFVLSYEWYIWVTLQYSSFDNVNLNFQGLWYTDIFE